MAQVTLGLLVIRCPILANLAFPIHLLNTSNLDGLQFSIQVITDPVLIELLVNPLQLMIAFRYIKFNSEPLITVYNPNNYVCLGDSINSKFKYAINNTIVLFLCRSITKCYFSWINKAVIVR